jgi:alpha-D-xyloside xylohydrolase
VGVTSWVRMPDCVVLSTDHGRVKIEPWTPSIVRVVHTLAEDFSQVPSLSVVARPDASAAWDVEEVGAVIEVRTQHLQVRVDRGTGAMTYADAQGVVLTREPAQGGRELATVNVVKTVFDAGAQTRAEDTADGVRVRAQHGRQVVDRVASRSKLAFVWADDEALYGLGSHDEGVMNLRGSQQYLYQHITKVALPLLVSTRGYGVFIDGYSLMTFHDDQYGSYLWSDVHDELDYYVIYGPEFDDIIAGYRFLTGPVPMLPKWAFGYVQCKEHYKSQEELLAVVREYRARQIPLDAIVQDWQYWPRKYWGQKSFDPERYPDPTAMTEQLHAMHARLMVSVWPSMTNDGPNQREMQQQGCLLGDRSMYDAFSAQARELYWKQAHEGLFAHGIDAWWCDGTEPFIADWQGAIKLEPEERMRINTEEAKRYLDPEFINAYSLLHSQGMYDGQRAVTVDKRVVNLTRSSCAGQHRYGTIIWSGDTSADWETLRRQIPAGLNFCAAGEPWWTLDVGGFFVRKRNQWFWNGQYERGCEDLGYRELYVRWFQLGTFLTMLRAHGTDTPREVWRFGEPGTPFYDALIRCIDLRYRLLPYIYSLAGAVTRSAYTMLRALPFDFRSDPRTYDIADQFMFGPALLVCPVATPMYVSAGSTALHDVPKTRSVYLPAGCEWYDFWTGARLQGGQRLEVEAPLDRLPLFVRAGSILPLGPVVQHTGEPVDAIELRIYRGRDGRFEFYDDEGDNYNYERGACEVIPVSWDDKQSLLTIGDRAGSYPTMPATRRFVLRAGELGYDRPDGHSPVVGRTVEYDGRRVTVRLGG